MTAQKAARIMKLQEWAKQIEQCHQSGMPTRQWCEENGIGYKNYYYRKKRVREELLDAMESGNGLMIRQKQSVQMAAPVFAEVPAVTMNDYSAVAATVQIGAYITEINNGANLETVEGVLRTLSLL